MKLNVVLFAAFSFGSVQTNAAITGIRWGSSGDPLSGLTVTWANSSSNDSIQWGYTPSFEKGRFVAASRSGNGGGYLLKYQFPAVTPACTVYYRLFDSAGNTWGAQRTFITSPDSTGPFSFLAMGDSRSNSSVWKQISDLAHSKNAAFTIFNGDIVDDGGNKTEWTSWLSSGAQFLENNLVYHSMGNHDAKNTGYYQNMFDLPKTNGTNLYYSFTYGDAVFICLNSENASDAAQYNWLKSTLQANQAKTWKIVFFHRPFYTIGPHAGEMNAQFSTWWKAFDDYGVDIVCNGHDHMYERTKPLNRNVSTSTPVSSYGSGPQDGRCQIVCGGAGAPLYTGSSGWFIEKYQSKYNFCKFDVNGCDITCTVYDNNNAVIETFSLSKCATGMTDGGDWFNKMTVAPNPTDRAFNLTYESADLGEGTITVYDINGKTVLAEKINKTENKFSGDFDLPNLPAGAYSVEIMVGNNKDNSLLIIK